MFIWIEIQIRWFEKPAQSTFLGRHTVKEKVFANFFGKVYSSMPQDLINGNGYETYCAELVNHFNFLDFNVHGIC